MRTIIIFAALFLIKASMLAQEIDHSKWQLLLDNHVNQGAVDYNGFNKDKVQLEAYLNELRSNVDQAKNSKESGLAYWMNAYNAFTVKLILDHYPVNSIRDIHNGNPWDVQWIDIGGRNYSLNEIEKEILLKEYVDPRVHFGINCAAKSCPKLSNTAFTSANVDRALNVLTKAFIQDQTFNTIENNRAQISQIFKWYADDFGDIPSFLTQYGSKSFDEITYQNYDWRLNQ